MKKQPENRLYDQIAFVYGQEQADPIFRRILQMLNEFRSRYPDVADSSPIGRVNQQDAILITYGDMVQAAGERPLGTLTDFLCDTAGDVISTVHILPFYPYSSDDGFSVIDYKQVNPDLGDWQDVARLGKNFRLMFDAVVNHISAESAWFQGFLRGVAGYEGYFIVMEPGKDLTQVFRPRATPVLTPFQTAGGEKLVWTTFSSDQIDLNYANPEVLLEVIDTLLHYVAHGAEFIRLDAIAFIWKEEGTTCLHLSEAHRIVQLMRTVLDFVAPRVSIITETNVPHSENISYFGNGSNEAQMVYNFSLPPLTLHAFHTGSSETLTRWAQTLELPSRQTTFFNFLASHDGIGLMPARGILPEAEIDAMARRVRALGGHVSYKSNPDGSQTAYELNINYLEALSDPDHPDEDAAAVARRFLASQAIMLALRGVPGIYFHSMFGSLNWAEGVQHTGMFRTINRQKLQRDTLVQELDTPDSLRSHVFQGYRRLLQVRRSSPAFHPNGEQQILALHPAIFAVLRSVPESGSRVLCLHNVKDQSAVIEIGSNAAGEDAWHSLHDLLSGKTYLKTDNRFSLSIQPYGVLWLVVE